MSDTIREAIGLGILITWLTGCVIYMPIVIVQFAHAAEHARQHGRNLYWDWEAPMRPGLLGWLTYSGVLLVHGMGILVHIASWPGALAGHLYNRIRHRRATRDEHREESGTS